MRLVSAAEAVAAIRSRDRVYVHTAAAAPQALVAALAERGASLHDVHMVHLHTEGPVPYVGPAQRGHFRTSALFVARNLRQAVADGDADYVPVFLSGSRRP